MFGRDLDSTFSLSLSHVETTVNISLSGVPSDPFNQGSESHIVIVAVKVIRLSSSEYINLQGMLLTHCFQKSS